jgi:hypothetical protein
MARPIAGFVVSFKDGRVHSQGSVSEVLSKDRSLASELKKEQQVLDKADDAVDDQVPPEEGKSDGKLIVAEEVEEGHVSWPACEFQTMPILWKS